MDNINNCNFIVDQEDEIVISGISGRFPKSSNVSELSYNLYNKVDMIEPVSLRYKGASNEAPMRSGFVSNYDKFDAPFFSIVPTHAMVIDPQQRLLQEHAYEAILDAGICPKHLRGSNTGVYIGCCFVDCEINSSDGMAVQGSSRCMLANRISFTLDFKGPSFAIDTACSSSGYALNLAYMAIRNGLCEAAIVGGSNLTFNEKVSLQFAKMGVLAMDGCCLPFDENAHGYVRSEAVNVIFLQKRKDAKRVYATVMHSKLNVDGYKSEGISFPSAELQSKLSTEVCQEIQIHPSAIDYIECHATGTKVGDPEECRAIDQVFNEGRTGPLLMGSMKSNMGHSEAAASNCSVIKSILIFENEKIPPMLHPLKPRQDIPSIISGRLKPVTEVVNFKGSLIAVNSFGFGGANSHVLLRKNLKNKINNGIPTDNIPRLLTWSGRTEEALNTIFDSVTKRPLDAEYMALLHNTQLSTLPSNTYRGYAIYTQDPESSTAICAERHIANFAEEKRPIVWIFSGMGSQWAGMGADLMKIPIFEQSIKRCHDVLAKKGLDLINIITSDDPKIFDNILHSFVGISAIQIGLTNILKAIGLEPDYIIGHSFGELGCAYADNTLTEEEMILASYSRGLVSVENKTIFGSMAAVGVGYKELKSMIDDEIYIACHNSADSSTISGHADKITKFVEKLKKQNIFAKEVQCSNIAYHSPHIASLGPELLNTLKPVITMPKQRSEKWISTSVPKSEWDTIEGKYSSGQYHTNNLLNPVLFEEGCENLPKNALTIEIAPHGLLQAIVKRALPNGIHLCLTKRGSKESSMLLYSSLGRLFENGIDLDLSKLYPAIEFPVSRGTPMISPFIKWNHDETYPVPTSTDKPINEKTYNLADPDFDFISGHEIDGRVLFPATGYLYLAWKTLAAQLKENFETLDVEFKDVKFIRACQIQKGKDQILSVLLQPETGYFQVSEDNTTLATGTVRCLTNSSLTEIEDIDLDDDILELDSAGFYKELRLRGYEYKKIFKSVVETKIDGSRGKVKWQSNWIAFLDCILQNIIITQDSRSLKIPTGMKKVSIKKNEHEKLMTELGDDPIAEVKFSSDLKTLRCGGIEIRDVGFSTIGRRPPKGFPVLETYQFVPHFPTPCFSNTDVGKFCMELAEENLLIKSMSCVEIDMNDEREPLCEYFGLAANDAPVITIELNYLTSKEIEIPLTKVSNSELSEFSNQTFIIRSSCLFDAAFLEDVKKYISTSSYIISRESKECEIFHDFEGSKGYTIAAVIPTESETLVLMQYRQEPLPLPLSSIKISNTDHDYSWLESLQKTAKTEPTLIYSEKESESGVLGLVNCIRREPGGEILRFVFIDDESAPLFNIDDPFYKDQLSKDLAINVYRNGQWGSFKHFLVKPEYEPLPCEGSAFANSLVKGDLSSIKWLQSSITKNSDKVINVQYAALNFKDVMLATGKLSVDTVSDNRLDLMCVMGLEFAGVTNDGRRLMGIKLAGAMASKIIEDEYTWSYEVPEDWTLEEAVTIPVVYGTVYISFFIKTKISRGKSILIHAGSGGIGLAAIRVAFAYGLEVFTTVSTEEKKNYLLNEFPELKRENIGNSRDTSFEDMIRKRTRGKGVDFVLNSLSEEKLSASIRCLGKQGKFLEIGKFDIANDNKINLGSFLNDLSFHAVFLDNMCKAQSDEIYELKKLVQDDIKKGIIKPLKTNVFNADEVESAFRLLASGKHIGKVVLKLRENELDNATLPISVIPRVYCNPEYSYIICGGLGGFGLELADWLILRGCKKLILSTSRGITTKYQAYRINVWESYGVQVQVNKSDITTRQGCEQLIDDASEMGPIGGIFNLAAQLRDSIFENQTVAKFNESMAPKAYATKYLDEISRTKCPKLQYFVVFSSVSCGRGNAGQSNYGMANSVMERIVEVRHKHGLPGKAIQWGAIGDVGLVANLQEDKIDMQVGGTLLQKISSCLEELDTLMTVDDPIVSSMVVAEKRKLTSGKGGVMEMLMNILSIKDMNSISMETKLAELGMDSLMMVEISQNLEREFNIILTPQQLRSITLAQIRALESNNKANLPSEGVKLNTELLVRSLGDESTSHLNILKLNDKVDESNTKALIFPGVEGVALKTFYDIANQIKFPAYALQCLNMYNITDINEMSAILFEDVAKFYQNDTSFLFIAYSYGSLLALKLAKLLEDTGKFGKVIFIDGSPVLVKRLFNELIPNSESNDQAVEEFALNLPLKYAFPNDPADRRYQVLCEPGWDAKLKKADEIYKDFKVYSREYTFKFATLFKNRLKTAINLSLDDFHIIKSPIKLIKPTNEILSNLEHDIGLGVYSGNDIEVTTLEGDHVSILEHQDLCNTIDSFFN